MRLRVALVAALCLLLPAAAAARHPVPPRVVSAEIAPSVLPAVETVLKFSGRDRDGVIRGYEVDFGDGGMTAISACTPRRPRRGRLARFEIAYTYLLPGIYTVKVRVLSGGCNEPQQRSRVVTRTVTVALSA